MILELVKWKIKPGNEDAFEEAFRSAEKYLESAEGYIRHAFYRCLESPNQYSLTVEWETLEHHIEGFRGSADYQDYKALISPYYESGVLEHYEVVN